MRGLRSMFRFVLLVSGVALWACSDPPLPTDEMATVSMYGGSVSEDFGGLNDPESRSPGVDAGSTSAMPDGGMPTLPCETADVVPADARGCDLSWGHAHAAAGREAVGAAEARQPRARR